MQCSSAFGEFRPMPDDIDIWRAANLLIKEHGELAELEAVRRADAMKEKGDMAGRAVWERILKAVQALALRAAPMGAAKH